MCALPVAKLSPLMAARAWGCHHGAPSPDSAGMSTTPPLSGTLVARVCVSALLAMRRNGRPLDWLDGRNDRLRAITRDGAARVAAALLKPQGLAVTVAGQPEGM